MLEGIFLAFWNGLAVLGLLTLLRPWLEKSFDIVGSMK